MVIATARNPILLVMTVLHIGEIIRVYVLQINFVVADALANVVNI
jgi:hypothetical protein